MTTTILEAFSRVADNRNASGKRHSVALCLSLFVMAIASGCQGFQAMGDWLSCHNEELMKLMECTRIPSYSTIRRILLSIDLNEFEQCLKQFLGIEFDSGDSIAIDGKTLKGSYDLDDSSESHPAIVLISVYLSKKGVILPMEVVNHHSQEAGMIPEVLKKLALEGVNSALLTMDAGYTQKKLVSS